MEKRRFGKTGLDLGILGFGAMRLPGFSTGQYNKYMDRAVELMREGIERGINYIDTAALYDGGKSEEAVGRALKGRREQVVVSSKILPSLLKSGNQLDYLIEASLKRLDTSYLDVFYLHGLTLGELEGPLRQLKIIERIDKLKSQGLIRHLGYSSHDKPDNIIGLIQSGLFECMLVQYNFLDMSNAEAIARAHAADMGVALMGPLGGGRLSGMGPEFNRLIPESLGSAPRLALRFVWNNPHVTTALSGMDRPEVLDENLATAESFTPSAAAEADGLAKLQEAFEDFRSIYCTGCGYCLPCEQKVKIPDIFYALICHKVLGSADYAKFRYNFFLKNHKADLCVECGECEEKCPQQIEIIEQLKEAHRILGGG